MPGQAALVGQPTRCRFCGRPRLTLDYHYAVCPRLEACLPIRRTRVRAEWKGCSPANSQRAYSQNKHCPECGKWITDKARACKRHMTLARKRGRGRALTVESCRETKSRRVGCPPARQEALQNENTPSPPRHT